VFVEDELIFHMDEDILELDIEYIDVQNQKSSTPTKVKCPIQMIQATYKRRKLRCKKPNTPHTIICGFGRIATL
jgi:hypothetical protein